MLPPGRKQRRRVPNWRSAVGAFRNLPTVSFGRATIGSGVPAGARVADMALTA
jgi:hypothetical protein